MSESTPHILIVTSRYYARIAEELEHGVADTLREADATYDVIEATGAFEIPAIIALAAEAAEYDGFVALGCVVRGETSHYDYVCGECARGIMNLSLAGVAVGFGVLTVENQDQAWVRADRTQKNKGREAARACLNMVTLQKHFSDVDLDD
tara:strand:- start:228 stop:677 length:450 start_codon:yes stop_codon:yes gene_type:complete